jgi:hypothetical protein
MNSQFSSFENTKAARRFTIPEIQVLLTLYIYVIISLTALIGEFRFSGALGHTDFLDFELLTINRCVIKCMTRNREKID